MCAVHVVSMYCTMYMCMCAMYIIRRRTPFVKKTPSEIHSQTITVTDRQKTLAPFALSGKAQVYSMLLHLCACIMLVCVCSVRVYTVFVYIHVCSVCVYTCSVRVYALFV